jgi:hypothetical protein
MNDDNFFAPVIVPYNDDERRAVWSQLRTDLASILSPVEHLVRLRAFYHEEKQILNAALAASSPLLRSCLQAIATAERQLLAGENPEEAKPSSARQLNF